MAELSEHNKSRSARTQMGHGWAAHGLTTLVALACGLIAGASLPMVLEFTSPAQESWNIIFIALGTLCLGFGAASVFFQHARARETASLTERYDVLAVRADSLLDDFHAYEKRKSR